MNKTFRIPVLGVTLRIQGRDVSSVDFYPELRGRLVRGDNSPVSIPMFGAKPKRELSLGVLADRIFSRDLIDGPNGLLLSRRVVTDAGVAFLVNDWFDASKDITNFNAHGNGTGSAAEAVGNVALGTEVGTRVAGTKSKPAANQLRTVATVAQGSTLAISEHGIFDSTTVLSSTLWDRSQFSAINVNNGDSIEYTYTLTVQSGG